MKHSILKLKDLNLIEAFKSDRLVVSRTPICKSIDQCLTDTQPYVNRFPCE
jgi:hypothetical protein